MSLAETTYLVVGASFALYIFIAIRAAPMATSVSEIAVQGECQSRSCACSDQNVSGSSRDWRYSVWYRSGVTCASLKRSGMG